MKISERICTQSDCYKEGKRIEVKGLMIHSVGCPQPKAHPFIKNWNKPGVDACVHAIIEPNGDVLQLLPWNYRGWHGGGECNNTHIGVEMTEPDTIEYIGGASWRELGDGKKTKEHVLATYKHAVELFAYLCNMYELEPLADGVIISHSEGHKRGIASNHGDVEHLWSEFGLSMTRFRKDIKEEMGKNDTITYTKIMGTAVATVEQMKAYIQEKNKDVAQSVVDMIPLYLSEGKAESVRGDIAFAQSCLETGNFAFSGSAVTLEQNNFCGMGVTAKEKNGNSFDTPQLGIRAQIQHLKAYACDTELANECVDPRFKNVTRGCAKYVEWLGQKENPNGKGWATGKGYGDKVLTILKNIVATKYTEDKKEESKPATQDKEWFRVRKTWTDTKLQKGAFHSLENAKKCADDNPGYSVFDESGKVLYPMKVLSVPYLVKVSIKDLNIRKGPGTDCARIQYIPVGVYTIVEEADGKGATKWGRLKSGAGWISLDYVTKL